MNVEYIFNSSILKKTIRKGCMGTTILLDFYIFVLLLTNNKVYEIS